MPFWANPDYEALVREMNAAWAVMGVAEREEALVYAEALYRRGLGEGET